MQFHFVNKFPIPSLLWIERKFLEMLQETEKGLEVENQEKGIFFFDWLLISQSKILESFKKVSNFFNIL